MKVWKIFVKIVKILFAFIPIHEEVINDKSEKESK